MATSRIKTINANNEYRIRLVKLGKLITITVFPKTGQTNKQIASGTTTLDESNAISNIEAFIMTYLKDDVEGLVKRETILAWLKGKQAERIAKLKEEKNKYDYYVVNTFIRDGDNEYNLKSLSMIPKGEEPYAYLDKTEILDNYHEPEEENGGYYIEGMCRFIEIKRADKITKKEFDLMRKYI